MKKVVNICFAMALAFASCGESGKQGAAWTLQPPQGKAVERVAIDTMHLRNPYIMYDKRSDSYYMTGDGGLLWRSGDMHVWQGPYSVMQFDARSWTGETPEVTSPEIHRHKDKFYLMATVSRPDVPADTIDGNVLARTSCEIFVADSISGPYKQLVAEEPLLSQGDISVHPTFCTDEFNVAYMIYDRSAEETGDATVQIVRLGKRLDVRVGEPYVMFRASQNPWGDTQNLSAPFLFDTAGGELGILFTSATGDEQAVGVAYTETGHGLNGPWHIEPQPLLKGVGGAMLFNDYDGTLIMAAHKDTVINGKAKSVPQLYKADRQFDKLKLNGHYKF